jgi:UDP-N-acetylmuramate dehydrogenase
VAVDDAAELPALLTSGRPELEQILVLGGGSNLLFTSDFEGLVLHMVNKGIEVVREDAEEVIVRVQAGEVWDDFVTWSTDRSLYGIENLVAIPGSVGAAPVQNIGAYGMEVSDSLISVEMVMLENGACYTLNHRMCEFGYRSSIFKHELKGQVVITAVTFKLRKRGALLLSYRGVEEILKERGIISHPTPGRCGNSDPGDPGFQAPRSVAMIGNAGSFFKNPVVSLPQSMMVLNQKHFLISPPTHRMTEHTKLLRDG